MNYLDFVEQLCVQECELVCDLMATEVMKRPGPMKSGRSEAVRNKRDPFTCSTETNPYRYAQHLLRVVKQPTIRPETGHSGRGVGGWVGVLPGGDAAGG